MKAPFARNFSRLICSLALVAGMLVGVAPVASAQVDCTAPPAGLIGWWRGENNALDSAGGNHGVMRNVTFTTGQSGQAFAFDPKSFPSPAVRVSIPDQPRFKLTNSLTIEGWIRSRGDGYAVLMRGDNRTGLDPYVLSMQANNVLRFYINDANDQAAGVETTLAYDQWWHVAATLDGDTGAMKLYVNGALASQTNTHLRPLGDLDPNYEPALGIGNVGGSFHNFPFTGDIDEIALYSRALSQAEIAAIYQAGSTGKSPPPHWATGPAAQTLAADFVHGAASIAPPLLSIALADQNLMVSWPAWASDFVLQASADPTAPAAWTNVSAPVITSGDKNLVNLPITGDVKFYRLFQP